MTEAVTSNSLARNPDLVVAGLYERDIGASLERVWENVYDWEHLPYLHSQAFTSITLIESGDWGWRAKIGMAGGNEGTIELIADRQVGHYVARTLDGPGAPSEIWTSLDPIAADETAIRVEFCVQAMPEEALRSLGRGLVQVYTGLWDQDEEMMQTRTEALAHRRGQASADDSAAANTELTLGTADELRKRLPCTIELGGHPFRIVEESGEFLAHSTECVHLLGPLGECDVENGTIVCPWHGYAFDLRTGRSCDGHGLRLRPAPRIEFDAKQNALVAKLPTPAANGSRPGASASSEKGA